MLSVILCVHNGEPWIDEQLAALSRQTFDGEWELVVVIDRCTDASEATVRRYTSQAPVRIVQVDDGSGLANARNVGVRAARGEYLLFCDADDVAAESWLRAMARGASESSCIGGHLEEMSLNDETIRAWRNPFTDGALPVAFERWPSPAGANFGMSADVIREIGGFDPTLPTGEEVDVGIRAQLLGHEFRYVPDAVIHYRHRGGLRPLAKQAYRYGVGNAELFHRFRSEGLRPTPARSVLGTLVRLMRGVPGALLDPKRRGAWVRYASYCAGQFVGGLRHRSFWIG